MQTTTPSPRTTAERVNGHWFRRAAEKYVRITVYDEQRIRLAAIKRERKANQHRAQT